MLLALINDINNIGTEYRESIAINIVITINKYSQ